MKRLLKRIVSSVVPHNVLSLARFEYRSRLGRVFAGPLRITGPSPHYINLGCGDEPSPDFINIDFWGASGAGYNADLRFPLRVGDGVVDGIYSEHTFEHLTYDEVDRLLSECRRIMKAGAVIRIIVPDVSLFVRKYADSDADWFRAWEARMFLKSPNPERNRRRLASHLQALSFVTQEYGHVSSWDAETMTRYLERNGFCDVRTTSFRSGRNPDLLQDSADEARTAVSLYIEGTAEGPAASGH